MRHVVVDVLDQQMEVEWQALAKRCPGVALPPQGTRIPDRNRAQLLSILAPATASAQLVIAVAATMVDTPLDAAAPRVLNADLSRGRPRDSEDAGTAECEGAETGDGLSSSGPRGQLLA